MTKTWEDIEEEVILYDIIVQIQEKKTQNAAINNITQILKEKIIQALSKTEGKRITDISNETGIDEKTVHHCLKYNLLRQCYVEEELWFIRQAPKQPKNQRWDVEESVALFSLYFKYGSSNKVPKEEVEKLSQVLNKRADRLGVKKRQHIEIQQVSVCSWSAFDMLLQMAQQDCPGQANCFMTHMKCTKIIKNYSMSY